MGVSTLEVNLALSQLMGHAVENEKFRRFVRKVVRKRRKPKIDDRNACTKHVRIRWGSTVYPKMTRSHVKLEAGVALAESRC